MGRAFDDAWDSVVKGIIFQGVDHEDLDTAMPAINEHLESFPETKLPELPFKGGAKTTGGKMVGMPWKKMIDQWSYEPLHNLDGFKNPEKEMLPTFMNWIGGKTSLMPLIRELAQDVRHDTMPAELFGGSGSFLFGMNSPRGGIYNDINPDLVNVMNQVRGGLDQVSIPQNQEELESYVNTMNTMRRKRDVLGMPLEDDENKFLAESFIGANNQQRDGRYQFKDWGEPTVVDYSDGLYSGPSYRQASKPPGHPNFRVHPGMLGSIDLSPFSQRMKDWEIYNYDFRDAANLLTRDHLAYWDPPYMSRQVEYGGDPSQNWGYQYDQDQKDVVDLMGEHQGPSIYSNYMYGKDTQKPYEELVSDLLNVEADIHPWLRKPKANIKPQVEMIATTKFPESTKARYVA